MEKLKMKKLLTIFTLLFSYNLLADNTSWIGQPAPNFDLPDQNGVFHTLKEYQGKWLVLYFYPKDDTPGCTTEAKNFTTDYKTIEKLGAVIVGASLDNIESHKAFAEKYKIPYSLLADKDEVMASAYKVVREVPLFHHAKRQTFIINPQGIIAKFYEKVSPTSHTTDVINDLKILQSQIN